ncbi:histone acetyltransferase KAT6B-like [Gigantopelta aegis]|uniref:histone acetyltransferase KAT6B-like n=1 Tax=Gigantopelta aegis TaxID=1735272 RepID=UPI001B88B4CE|nr:histone acetyltransferase KAT6B-like [Gigantopelta aegis]
MANPKVRKYILETIDQLRKRKARPDLERICHMVKRKHGLCNTETEANLDKLVDSEIVIKVNYKGNTSYRNGSKWKKRHLGGIVLNSSTSIWRVHEAIREISSEKRTRTSTTTTSCGNTNECKDIVESGKVGVELSEIENWLSEHFEDNFPLNIPLSALLQKETDATRIEKLPDGTFVMPPPPGAKPATKPKVMDSNRIHSAPSRRGRPPKKNKEPHRQKPRPVVDTEEESMDTLPSSTAPSPSPSPQLVPTPQCQDGRCNFCQQTWAFNRKGQPEKFLVCKDCGARAHPSCMDYSVELAKRASRLPWQCIDCKTCYVCTDAGDPDLMLFCDGCDKGYHTNCHQPNVSEKPLGKWVCSECESDGVSAKALDSQEVDGSLYPREGKLENEAGPSFLHTPCDSPIDDRPEDSRDDTASSTWKYLPREPRLEGQIYPNASDWSIDDVVTFFKSVGFDEQAEAFREQEIDGKSLLLMKRSDVLTGLSIKLGPALKIYVHVKCLQTTGHKHNADF